MIGQTLSHYRIVAQLGAGGMGVVYRARDERLQRDVALKVLPAGAIADETSRARLLREARMASALNHPNICHIYEVGEEQGNAYIAMELVEGRSLRETIPKGGLPIEKAIRHGAQIADALAHAHERGVIHRDLKSANVVITPEGRAKVLDFGLAKRVDQPGDELRAADLDLTQSGIVVGTPHYLPPEVLGGAKADERSDLWALGVVLYEMTSGELPFAGRTVLEICSAIRDDSPAPLPPRVPPGLRSIIQRCLAKEPSERYRRASEVHAALSALHFDSGPVATGGARGRFRRAFLWPLAGLAVAIVAALVLSQRGGLRGGPGTAASDGRVPARGSFPPPPVSNSVSDVPLAHPIRSLAVLPLANLSGDSDQDYFADGMTEELITNLAPIGSLKVISRTSVMRYKGTTKSLPEIVRELGVDGIVEGSVMRSGDRVRITAQLIDAAEDRHIWAKSYERELTNIITLQREVAVDIAEMINLQLTPEEHARMATTGRTVNLAANDLYMKGRFHWGKITDESVRKSVEFFKRAIALDPGDPRYYTGLADAYAVMGHLLNTMPLSEAMPLVKENARKALALDDASSEAHAAMALALFFADWDWSAAKEHAERAIALSPGNPEAHFIYAVIVGAEGHTDEAIEHGVRARDLDPLSLLINWDLSSQYFYAERYDEALAQAARTLEIDPTSQIARSQPMVINETRGDFAGLFELYEKYANATPDEVAAVKTLKAAYEAGGVRGYFQGYLDLTSNAGAEHESVNYQRAHVYARMGDTEKALECLEKSIAARTGDMLFIKVDPRLKSLRGNSRFDALIRRVGLTP